MDVGLDRLSIYKLQNGKPSIEIANLRFLDQFIRLEKSLKEDSYYISRLDSLDLVERDLKFLHQLPADQDLGLFKVSYKFPTSCPTLTEISLKDLFINLKNLLRNFSSSFFTEDTIKSNLEFVDRVLEKYKEVSNQPAITSSTPSSLDLQNTPLLVVYTKAPMQGRRLIVNPSLKQEAKECLRQFSTEYSFINLESCDRARLAGDPRVAYMEIPDVDIGRKLFEIKYANSYPTEQPNWQEKTVSYLRKLVSQSKVFDLSGNKVLAA